MSRSLNLIPKKNRMQKHLSWLMAMKVSLFAVLMVIMSGYKQQENLFFTDSGHVEFSSDAPLEYIQASSNELAGILNINDLSFSFTVSMVSFQGFNSALQRTHFN